MPESQLDAPHWKDWFWWFYGFTPPVTDKVRRYCAPTVAMLRNLRVPMFLSRGLSLVGTECTVITAGDPRWVNDVVWRFFSDMPTIQPLESVPSYRLARTLREWSQRVDVVFARVDRFTARHFDSNYLTVPDSISLTMSIPENIAQLNRLNSNVKEDVRRVRSNSFGFEVSHPDDNFHEFYDRYHVPLMRIRHGPRAVVRNRYLMRRFIHNGGILWITRDGQRVAASTFMREGQTLTLVTTGIKDGRLDIMRMGASPAIYYFAACYAMQQGYSHLELGSTPPFLNDGLYQYKRKWGPKISSTDSAYASLIHWPRLNDAVHAFLADSGLIFCESDKLSAITALRGSEPGTVEQAVKLFSQFGVRGLHRFWIISMNSWQQPEQTKTIEKSEVRMVQTVSLCRLRSGTMT